MACSSLSGSGTASIVPGCISPINRPRSATSRSASSTRSTPDTHAATYSPMLWPIIAAGTTPQLIQSLAMRQLDHEERRLRHGRLLQTF